MSRHMRSYLVNIAIVLAVHVTTAFVSRTYLGFLDNLGGLFVHRTDIASIPDSILAGFLITTTMLVIGTTLMTYLNRRKNPQP